MAFNKLKGIDSSDMAVWANTPACEAFICELNMEMSKDIRNLIKHPTEANAEKIRQKEIVLRLFEEARKMK